MWRTSNFLDAKLKGSLKTLFVGGCEILNDYLRDSDMDGYQYIDSIPIHKRLPALEYVKKYLTNDDRAPEITPWAEAMIAEVFCHAIFYVDGRLENNRKSDVMVKAWRTVCRIHHIDDSGRADSTIDDICQLVLWDWDFIYEDSLDDFKVAVI